MGAWSLSCSLRESLRLRIWYRFLVIDALGQSCNRYLRLWTNHSPTLEYRDEDSIILDEMMLPGFYEAIRQEDLRCRCRPKHVLPAGPFHPIF